MTQDALEALAVQIDARHTTNLGRVEALRSDTITLCNEAFEISKLVMSAFETLGPRRFVTWWRERNLPPGWARRYLTLNRTAGRHTLGDKDQLRLIGILPEAESDNVGSNKRQENHLGWLSHVGKINRSVTVQTIGKMSRPEVVMALQKLAPIRELIKALEARTGDTKGK